ncbi:MAG: hypothetical protein WD185_08605, partial [Sneathiella sp.]
MRFRTRHDYFHTLHGRGPPVELGDQRRQQGDGVAQRREHGRRSFQRAVDDAVQQILDGPGEIADPPRADHAAAALQRVEGAAHAGQR